jgi:hypothetical protein
MLRLGEIERTVARATLAALKKEINPALISVFITQVSGTETKDLVAGRFCV